MPNPEYEFGRSGIKMSLTEICHSIAITAYHRSGKDQDAYVQAYYGTMRRLTPDHPALDDERCGKLWGKEEEKRTKSRHKQGIMDV